MLGYPCVNYLLFRRIRYMNDPFPYPERALDRAVRARLDTDAQAANTGHILSEIQGQLLADAARPPRRTRRWIVAAAAALAASILLAVFLLLPGGMVQASPKEVVERARSVHQGSEDRCYVVHAEVPPLIRKRFPRSDFDRESKLWTRGDRYFVEMANGHGFWGRDESRRVWIVPTPDAAARFDDDEVPAAFREFLDIRAVNLPDLLDEVLAHCDLSWATNVDAPNDVERIYAVSRDSGRSLRGAVIDVEKQTNVIRRLSLDRQLFRDPRLKFSVSFTLVNADPPDPVRYSPEGHLRPGSPILDRTHPRMRRALLVRHFGRLGQD